MKLSRTLAAASVAACLTFSASFPSAALPVQANYMAEQKTDNAVRKPEDGQRKGHSGCRSGEAREYSELLTALQEHKAKVQTMLNEGKITKEKADARIAWIDAKIKEVQKFDSLSVQKKKDRLVKDFRAETGKKVKEGKLTKEKADEINKKYEEKVKNWDGSKYPHFVTRVLFMKK